MVDDEVAAVATASFFNAVIVVDVSIVVDFIAVLLRWVYGR